jgi:hypothetical protein
VARRLSIAAALGAVAALGLGASTAGATTQSFHDKRGDSKSDVDLRSASVDYDGTTLKFRITTYEQLPHGLAPAIEVDFRFLIVGNNAVSDQTGEFLFKVKHRRTHKSITYSFSPSRLSDPPPGNIRWRAVALAEQETADFLPNRGLSKLSLAP